MKVPGQPHPVQQKKDLPSNLKTEVWRGQLLGKVSATSLEGRPDREAICGASGGAGLWQLELLKCSQESVILSYTCHCWQTFLQSR